MYKEIKKEYSIKNMKKFPEYKIWEGMKTRCYNKNIQQNKTYHEKNILVCDEWVNNFEQFLSDMGRRPNDDYTIERIDNNKSYEKDNCMWIHKSFQSKNRGKFNIKITHNGETMILKDWSKKLGIKYTTLYTRMNKQKMSFQEAIAYSNKTEYKGFVGTLKQIVEKFRINNSISYQLVCDRMYRGWTLERSLNTKKG